MHPGFDLSTIHKINYLTWRYTSVRLQTRSMDSFIEHICCVQQGTRVCVKNNIAPYYIYIYLCCSSNNMTVYSFHPY
uniref:Uncharacterized protein n=1 Tax=Zea mays TaxID=4577 RepID=C0PLZ7_MAIZE|nr:unknown [Zea mays]